jgi:hypothetical protein
MLRKAVGINDCTIIASDGRLGYVTDLLFDDASWLVRWVVVDTGNWLPNRTVLLPASILGHLDQKENSFAVRLTMQEVRDSPEIETHQPVSRQMEGTLYDHYGWTPYWSAGLYVGRICDATVGAPPSVEPLLTEDEIEADQRIHGDPHLRSTGAVTGYHIHATDGEIGHVADFLIEDGDWSIHYMVVDTKNWWPGKKVLISPRSVREINWADKLVYVNSDRQRVKDSPDYDESVTVDRAYEKRFQTHYGAADGTTKTGGEVSRAGR